MYANTIEANTNKLLNTTLILRYFYFILLSFEYSRYQSTKIRKRFNRLSETSIKFAK